MKINRIDIIGQNGNTGEHYSTPDMINHPPHYTQGAVECIDAMQSCMTPEQYVGYLRGNALKYIWRIESKGSPVDNAEKAIWYLQKYLEAVK